MGWKRFRRFLLNLVVLLVTATTVAGLAARKNTRPTDWTLNRPLVMAHQGGDGLRPSNTMAAFENAVELGVDVLEMDVHLSADGELVLIHDATVDRTTDGAGAVASMSLAELKSLDAGFNWPTLEGHELAKTTPYRGQGMEIPTLDEVLAAFPQMLFNIEIKPKGIETALALCDKLRAFDAADRTLVASFNDDAMDAFRQACPEVLTSSPRSEITIVYAFSRLQLEDLVSAPSSAFQVPIEDGGFFLMTDDFVDATQDRGMLIHAWTINEPDDIALVLAVDVDGVITDYPDRVLAERARLDANPDE